MPPQDLQHHDVIPKDIGGKKDFATLFLIYFKGYSHLLSLKLHDIYLLSFIYCL